ncbi:MAG: DNA polymerase III subunit gamma/tau [Candidatus Neomarinimicrobiota bacterium]
MAYQVLARKYRPEKFQGIIGQEHVTQTLLNAFAQDRVAHAYLFAGPRGIGKTTTARVLAKALNCLKNDDGNPCDKCRNCEEIATSRSMDVLEIDGASNRGIDEIRNLRELVKYPPINAEFKIFIIDEVHMLTTAAFNALLKTLEEPPPHVKFIFATTEPNKVPATILSRCQRHDFHRLAVDDLLKGMRQVLESEKVSIDDRTEKLVANMADGSMRDALSLLDQIIAYCGSDIVFEQASSLLGIIPGTLFFGITDAIKARDRKSLLRHMQSVHSEGYSLANFLSGLNRHFLNFLICKADSAGEVLETTEEMLERYVSESKEWKGKDILRYMDQVTETESKLKIVQQPRIFVETMMLKLLEMDSSVTISDIITKLSVRPSAQEQSAEDSEQPGLFEQSSSKGAEQTSTEETEKDGGKADGGVSDSEVKKSEDDPSSEPLETIRKRWDDIISKVSENGTSLGTFLSQGFPAELKGKRLTVSFPKKYKFHIDVLKKKVRMIESTVEEIVDETLRIEFVVEEAPEETHPVAKRMLELFGGEIVEQDRK